MKRAFVIVVFAAGCSGPATMGTPVDGATVGDAPPAGAPGLVVTWSTKAPVPGPIATGLTVDSITLKVRNLRAIGDSGNGDSRTSQEESTVAWSATDKPRDVSFPDAPTGLYAKVSFELDGQILDSSFEVQGTVDVGGTIKHYDIHDRDESNLSLPVALTLLPGGHGDFDLVLDLAPALATIDFTTLHTDDDVLQCDNSDSQIGGFRNALRDSGFSVAGVQ
jgi:hypothetical protein